MFTYPLFYYVLDCLFVNLITLLLIKNDNLDLLKNIYVIGYFQ